LRGHFKAGEEREKGRKGKEDEENGRKGGEKTPPNKFLVTTLTLPVSVQKIGSVGALSRRALCPSNY